MARADTGLYGVENHSFSMRRGGGSSMPRHPPVTAKPRKIPTSSSAAASPSAGTYGGTFKSKRDRSSGKKSSVSRGMSTGARNGGAAVASNAASSLSQPLLEKFSTVRDLLPQRLNAIFSLPASVSLLEKKGGGSGLSVAATASPGMSPSHQKSLSSNSSSFPTVSLKKGSGGESVPVTIRRGSMGLSANASEDSMEELFRQLRNACLSTTTVGSAVPTGGGPTIATTPSSACTGQILSTSLASSTLSRNALGKKNAGELVGKRSAEREDVYERKNSSALPAISSNAASSSGEDLKKKGKKDRHERKSFLGAPSIACVGLSIGSRKSGDSGNSSPMGAASAKQRSRPVGSPNEAFTPSHRKERTAGNSRRNSGSRPSGGKGPHPLVGPDASHATPFSSSSLSSAVSDATIASLSTSAEAERITHHILLLHWLLFPSTFPVEEPGVLHDEESERVLSSSLVSSPLDLPHTSSAASSPNSTTDRIPSVQEHQDGFPRSSPRTKNHRPSNTSEPGTAFSSPTGTSGGGSPANTCSSKRAWKVILQKPRSIFPLLLAAARGDIVVHDMSVAACLFTLLYNMLRAIPTDQQRKVVQLCVKLGLHRICANVLQVCCCCSNAGALIRPHDLGFHSSPGFPLSRMVPPSPHAGNATRPGLLPAHPMGTSPAALFAFSLDSVDTADSLPRRRSSGGGSAQGSGSGSSASGAWKSYMRLKVAARVCEAAALLLSLSVMSSSKISASARSSGLLLSLTQAVETYGGVLEHRLSQHRSAADFYCFASRPTSGQEGGDKHGGGGGGGGTHHSTAAPLPHSKAPPPRRNSTRSMDVVRHSTTNLTALRGCMGRGRDGGGGAAGTIAGGAGEEKDGKQTLSLQDKQLTLAVVKHFFEKTEWLVQCFLRLMLVLHLLSRSSANVQEMGAAIPSSSSSSSSPPLLTVTTKVFLALAFSLTHIFPKVLKCTACSDVSHLLPLSPHVDALSDSGQYVPSFVMEGVRWLELTLFWSLMLIRRICGEEACAERAIGEVHSQHLLRSLFKLIKHMAVMQKTGVSLDGVSLEDASSKAYAVEHPSTPGLPSPPTPPPPPPTSPPPLPFHPSPSWKEKLPDGPAEDAISSATLHNTSLATREAHASPSPVLLHPSALLLPLPKESSSSVATSSTAFLCIHHPKMVHVTLHTFGIVLNGMERGKGLRDLQEVNGSLTELVEHVLCIPDNDPAEWLQRYHHLCEIFGVCLLPSLKTSFPVPLAVSTTTSLNSSCLGSTHKSEPSLSGRPAPRRRVSLTSSPSGLPNVASLLLEHSPFFDPELNLRLPVQILQSSFGTPAEEKGVSATATAITIPPPLTSASARSAANPDATASGTAVRLQGSEKSGPVPTAKLFSSARRDSTGEKGGPPLTGSARDEPTGGLPPVQEGGRSGSTVEGAGAAGVPFSASLIGMPHVPPRRTASGRGGASTTANGLLLVDTHPALLFPECSGGDIDPISRMPSLDATPLPWAFTDPPPPSTMTTLGVTTTAASHAATLPSVGGDDNAPLIPPTPETMVRFLRHHIARFLLLSPECSDFTPYRHSYAVVYERKGLLHPAFTYVPGEEVEEEEEGLDRRSEGHGSARDGKQKKRRAPSGGPLWGAPSATAMTRRRRRRSGSLDSDAVASSSHTSSRGDLGEEDGVEAAQKEASSVITDSMVLGGSSSSVPQRLSDPMVHATKVTSASTPTLPTSSASPLLRVPPWAVGQRPSTAGSMALAHGGSGGATPPPTAFCGNHSVTKEGARTAQTLVFGSNFESGNLQRAIRLTPDEYDLVLSFDTCTNSFVQWFCFSVSNYTPGHKYRFNILNMEKPASTFNDGQRPLLLHIPLTPEEEAEKERREKMRRSRPPEGAVEGGGPPPTTVVIMNDHGNGPTGSVPSADSSLSFPFLSTAGASTPFPFSSTAPALPPGSPPLAWTRVGEDIYYFPNSFRRPARETAKKVFASSKMNALAWSSILTGNAATCTTACSSVTSSSSSFPSVVRPSQPLPPLSGGSHGASAATTAAGGRRGKGRRGQTVQSMNSMAYSSSNHPAMSGAGSVSFLSRGRATHALGGVADASASPEELQYYSGLIQKEARYYTLGFTVTMPRVCGKVYLANCFPYTYSDLRHMLDSVSIADPRATHTSSLSRRPSRGTASSSSSSVANQKEKRNGGMTSGTPETWTPDTTPDEEERSAGTPSPQAGGSSQDEKGIPSERPAGTRCAYRSTSATPSSLPPPPLPSSFMVQQLCVTNCGIPIPLVTATAMYNSALHAPYTTEEIQRRPVCLMTARVHPGESNSSWMMHGILDFLAAGARELHRQQESNGAARESSRAGESGRNPSTSSASVAIALLETFVFKIIPMVNVDGVIMGNHRCSILGVDLNREYLHPSAENHPVLYALKGILSYMTGVGRRRVVVAADFHGHSRAKNFLLYGCTRETLIQSFKLKKKVPSDCFMDPATGVVSTSVAPEKLFSAVLAQYCTAFDLCHSNFCIQKGKFNTNRVVLYREYGIRMCYGVEASMMGGRGAVTSYAAAADTFLRPDSTFSLSSFSHDATSMSTTGRGNASANGAPREESGERVGAEEPSPWACATEEDVSSPSTLLETHYSEATFSAFGMAFLWSLHTLSKSERIYCNDRFVLTGANGGGWSASPSAASVPDGGGDIEEGKEDEECGRRRELLQEPLAMKHAWMMVSQAGSGRQSPPGFIVLHPTAFPSSLWDALPANWNSASGSGLGPYWNALVHRNGGGGGSTSSNSNSNSCTPTSTGSPVAWGGNFSTQAMPLLLVPLYSPSCALFALPPSSPLLLSAGGSSTSPLYPTATGSGRPVSHGVPPRAPLSAERMAGTNHGVLSYPNSTSPTTNTNAALWKTVCLLAFSHLLPLSFHQRLQILNVLLHDAPLTVSLDECAAGSSAGGGGGEDDDDGGGDDEDDGKWGGGKGRRSATSHDKSGDAASSPRSKNPCNRRKAVQESPTEKVDESDSDGESGESEEEGERDFSPPSHSRRAPSPTREEEEGSGEEGTYENDEGVEEVEEGTGDNEYEREDSDDGDDGDDREE